MMLSLMYLLIFVVWAIAVIVLKCKNAKEKREAEEAAIQSAAISPDSTVHVIQIGSNYYDVVTMPQNHATHCQQTQQRNLHNLSNPPRYSQYQSTMIQPPVAQVNQGFVVDEGGIFPTTTPTTADLPIEPPPSYDEVMKLPKSYHSTSTIPTISLTTQR